MTREGEAVGKVIEKETEIQYVAGGSVGSPKGFVTGGRNIGLRHSKPDLGWIYSEKPAAAAGVYTTNLYQAAPLLVTKDSVGQEQTLQAVLVNSVNANSCTGDEGVANAFTVRKWFAKHLSLPERYVAVASTGVIGLQLPMDKMKAGIAAIALDGQNEPFEQAILTTDTQVKQLAVRLTVDGKTVTIGGAAKGSGMIHPNMATMLGFVTTDANVLQPDLAAALKEITNHTFNCITVDGDTSTNDMVLTLANGAAGNKPLTKDHKEWPLFVKGLSIVCRELAKKIARDGEGATKLIEVQVEGAKDDGSAQAIAKTIVGSSLVKTAVYGNDANWGRIVCAMGYSGETFDPKKASVSLGNIPLFENGLPVAFNEEEAKSYLQSDTILIKAGLGEGSGKAVAWGCDLTYDYVKINASYRS